MNRHTKFITGKSEVWAFGIGYDPDGMLNFDFLRWYLIITWSKK